MADIATKNKTREEKTLEAVRAPMELNLDVKFNLPKINSYLLDNEQRKKYICTCCGQSWDNPKNKFIKSASPLYQANDGYINICNECRDRYYYTLRDFYCLNESHAIKHFCQQFDIIFDENAVNASRQISADRSRISHYMAKKNLGQTAKIGATYIDGMKYRYAKKQDEVIESKEQAKEFEMNVTGAAIDRWGAGFTEQDYKNLDDHYKMLKKNNPNCDSNQEIFIKSLCNLDMLSKRALKEGDSDKYMKLTEQYSKTFTKAGLKTIQEIDNSADETLGVTLATISQFTPEEYYNDRKLYKDFDGLGDYFERFVKRPLKNLMTGSTDRDKEYYVKDDRVGDEDE